MNKISLDPTVVYIVETGVEMAIRAMSDEQRYNLATASYQEVREQCLAGVS